MAVGGGHAHTLGADDGLRRGDDDAILHAAPDLERLLLALLLLAGDVGNDVVEHLGPALERLARAGDGLIGANDRALGAQRHERVQRRNIGLDGAVGLDGDEPHASAQAAALVLDDAGMLGVELGDDHGHVGRAPVRGVVGDDGRLQAGAGILELAYGGLGHVDGAEAEVDALADGGGVGRVDHDEVPRGLGDGLLHGPAALDGLLVGLAGAARGGGDGAQLKPGVAGEQRDEALADHARGADDGDAALHGCGIRLLHGKGDLPNAILPRRGDALS